MKEHLAKLGLLMRDRVTGFQGIVTSVCFDLYGCVQYAVDPVVSSDKPNELAGGRWFDEKRLVALDTKPVMEVPTFESIPGPASKPSFWSLPVR